MSLVFAGRTELTDCQICPRACRVNRVQAASGFCRTDAGLNISHICLHKGEEPVLVGETGICNVFFQHCNLQCCYCQNFQISDNRINHELGNAAEQRVAEIEACLDQGVRCVGFVSPSHVLPQMRWLMQTLKARGRNPVFVMNTNGYDRVEQLRKLEGLILVYLPDFKYMDPQLAREYSGAANYPEVAQQALREMYRQLGSECRLTESGEIISGLIIRHLVLPGQVENSKQCLQWIAGNLSPEVHVSLMAQYTPTSRVSGQPELGRGITEAEYEEVVEEMARLGLENGWLQGHESVDYYCPNFDQNQPFVE